MSRAVVVFRRKHLDHLARDRFALNLIWVGFRRHCPDPDLKTFHGQNVLVKQPVADAKAAAAPLRYLRFDDYCVRKSRRRLERGAQVDQRNTHNLMGVGHLPLGQPGLLEQGSRACIEIGQVARVVHNLGGVAITPLDLYRLPVSYICLLAHQ